jgi:maltooligosyltrehalose trehalohydrolase
VEAVRKGRGEEFSHFGWQETPDPQDEAAFLDSKINPTLREEGHHGEIFEFYRTVIGLRKELAPLLKTGRDTMEVATFEKESALLVRLPQLFYAASFSGEPVKLKVPFEGPWRRVFESSGAGSADSPSVNIHGVVRLGPYGFSLYRMDA